MHPSTDSDMSTVDPIPWTPDFESYPCDIALIRAEVANGYIQLYWEDGRSNKYDVFLLRENSPDDQTIHFQSREMLISPLTIPEDLQAVTAAVDENGALHVVWSSGEQRWNRNIGRQIRYLNHRVFQVRQYWPAKTNY